jgi:uncharacterized secreted protein with C-terminal beta-propeller domain
MEESMDTLAVPMMAKSSVAAPASAGAVAADDFSTTNIQVEGVDEADIIKNDGKYIYMIKDDVVKIIEAYPPSIMKELGELDFDDETFRPTEMYINEDQLVIIGRGWDYYDYYDEVTPLIYPPRKWWRGSETVVYIIDVSDRSNPEEERVVRFDGNYNTSRRIGDDMYMVLNTNPNVWYMDEIARGEDLLPYYKDGDNDAEKMVGCADIHYFPGFVRPNYLITVSIPLDDADGDIDRDVFLGSSDNVYASQKNLYVSTSQTSYDYYSDWDWNRDRTHTLVFKFGLEDGSVNYKSRGRVPGRILNQFSMDEHSEHFRIATNIGWGDSSTNNVFVLDKNMKKVGEITDIAPGEKIYSTRFLGDRLYMVTFEQVDPLFVIDLATPSNPKILGKLKIPGFSNYLHPYDANHIIGFGKDTDVSKYGNVLMQGFKMALFDVSDVANPKQKFAENIGDRGTDSELLRNHKALLFDKEKELLAFPIRIQEKVTPAELECSKYRYSDCPNLCQRRCIPSSCTTDSEGRAMCTDDCEGLGSCQTPEWDRYQTTFSGAVVYTLSDSTGFKERGRVTHYDEEEKLKMGEYWPYNHNANIQRIIYIGDFLYSISQSKVKANEMTTVNDVSAIELD